MKVVILAGGFGSRLHEATQEVPKPLVPIGDKPIIWHIMKIYSSFGFNDFVILCGYKHEAVKNYFVNYRLNESDIEIDMATGEVFPLSSNYEPWKVQLVNTGLQTMTGGRVNRVRELLGGERFFLTYGDGVADINIEELLDFHIAHGGVGTMSSVLPFGRFGTFKGDPVSSRVTEFLEKPMGDGGEINGGFFVFEPEIFDYLIGGDSVVLEREPLESMSKSGDLYYFRHSGFWKCMDTMKDKLELEEIVSSGAAPWVRW